MKTENLMSRNAGGPRAFQDAPSLPP